MHHWKFDCTEIDEQEDCPLRLSIGNLLVEVLVRMSKRGERECLLQVSLPLYWLLRELAF